MLVLLLYSRTDFATWLADGGDAADEGGEPGGAAGEGGGDLSHQHQPHHCQDQGGAAQVLYALP